MKKTSIIFACLCSISALAVTTPLSSNVLILKSPEQSSGEYIKIEKKSEFQNINEEEVELILRSIQICESKDQCGETYNFVVTEVSEKMAEDDKLWGLKAGSIGGAIIGAGVFFIAAKYLGSDSLFFSARPYLFIQYLINSPFGRTVTLGAGALVGAGIGTGVGGAIDLLDDQKNFISRADYVVLKETLLSSFVLENQSGELSLKSADEFRQFKEGLEYALELLKIKKQ